MGYAIPAAAAIIFAAVAITGTNVTNTLMDSFSKAGTAEREAFRLAEDSANTRITITNVQRNGNTVTVTATNAGTVVLDANEVQVTADGLYKTLTSLKVSNSATNSVWAPGTVLEVKFTQNTTPSSVLVIPENGVFGKWGA